METYSGRTRNKRSTIHTLLVVTVITASQSIAESCFAWKFVKTEGMALPNHVIKTVEKSFVQLCWDECASLPDCLSVNARKVWDVVFECDLNNASTSMKALVPTHGSDYYEMKRPEEAICKLYSCQKEKTTSACASSPCKNGGTCATAPGTAAGYTCACPSNAQGADCGTVVIQGALSWQNALNECQSRGANLPSIHSAADNLEVKKLYDAVSSQMWIGLKRNADGTTYEWSDSTPYDYQNWRSGSGNEGCAYFTWDGKWESAPCAQSKRCVCV